MNGVIIMEQHLCRELELIGLIGYGIFSTLLTVGSLTIYKYGYKSADKITKITIRFCSILLIVLYIVFWGFQINSYNTTHMEYTVVVDDNVSFNEFYKKYEIISVDGNKYRVVGK